MQYISTFMSQLLWQLWQNAQVVWQLWQNAQMLWQLWQNTVQIFNMAPMLVWPWSYGPLLEGDLLIISLNRQVQTCLRGLQLEQHSTLSHDCLMTEQATVCISNRNKLGYILYIFPLRYSRKQPCAEAQISVLRQVLSPWSE